MGKKKILKGSAALLLSALVISSGAAVLTANAQEIMTDNYYTDEAPGFSHDVYVTKFDLTCLGTSRYVTNRPIRIDIEVYGAQKSYDSYNFAYVDILDSNGEKVTTMNYNDAPLSWVPTKTGTYTANFFICDYYGAQTSASKEFEVTAPLSLELLLLGDYKTNALEGEKMQLVAETQGGKGRLEYQFICNYKGTNDETATRAVLQDYARNNCIDVTFDKVGTYEFTVNVKDSYCTTFTSTRSINAIKPYFVYTTASPASPMVNETVSLSSYAINLDNRSYTASYEIKSSNTTTVINGIKDKTVTWKPSEPGTYTITVSAIWKDTVYASKTISVEVADTDLGVDVEAEYSQAAVGMPVTVNIYPKGGTGIYTVSSVSCDWQGHPAPDNLTKVSDTEYVLTPTSAGPYEIFAKVTDSLGNTASNSFIVIGDSSQLKSLEADKTDVKVNETVNLTAKASGSINNISVQYTISNGTSVQTFDGVMTKRGVYTAGWIPQTAGTYTVTASLTYNDRTIESKQLTVTVAKEEVTPPVSNGTVTLYYKGYAAPQIEYRTDSEEWSEPVKMTRVTAVAGVTHKYTINLGSAKEAVVRFSNGKGGVDDLNGQNYTFTKGLYVYDNGLISTMKDRNMLNSNTFVSTPAISDKAVVLGKSVTVSCTSTGGTGNYQYAFSYRKIRSAKWTTAQDYSGNSSVTVKPAAYGQYVICVKAKDDSGIVQTKYFVVDVVDKAVSASNISAENIKLGETVTVNCAAAGSSGNYTYAVFYKKKASDTYSTVKNYSKTTVVNVKPAAATEYEIIVKAKDTKTGVISRQEFTVLVAK